MLKCNIPVKASHVSRAAAQNACLIRLLKRKCLKSVPASPAMIRLRLQWVDWHAAAVVSTGLHLPAAAVSARVAP